MDLTVSLCVIAALYLALYFFDTFFKTCAHYPYIQFLKGTGFEIKFLQIRWSTNAFNRTFVRWGNNNSRFFDRWFTIGSYISLICLPISILLLLFGLVQNYIPKGTSTFTDNVVIEPIIPGITLPASELGYYALTLIVSSVIHELGHALAAVKEDVHVINLGVNIYFILPIAYVQLSSDKLNSLNQWRALKILCAGIWHNIVLTVVAYFIYKSIPVFYSTLFYTNSGVYVKELASNSPLLGAKGLDKFDTITHINNCAILDENTYFDCLQITSREKIGYCIATDLIHRLDESIPLSHSKTDDSFECCDPDKPGHLCFEYLDENNGVMEIPPYMCLPAREIILKYTQNCGINNLQPCESSFHCIRPYLGNFTKLMKIQRDDKADVIYIGHPSDIWRTVDISSFIPKYSISKVFVPDIVFKFLEYIIIFSMGLGLVNVLPCIFMDGQYIIKSLLIISFSHKRTIPQLQLASVIISLLGTALLLWHCFYNIYMKLF